MCRSTPVVSDTYGELLGAVDTIFLNPDTGRVEGFFVLTGGFLQPQRLFLSSSDIRRWGTAVEVKDGDALGPLEDHVRLEKLSHDGRRVLGQPMRTEGGQFLGRCADVQFDTESFQLQWLFPKRWRIRWGLPVPVHAVLEVNAQAIVVRERAVMAKEDAATPTDIVTSPTAA